MSDSAGNRLLVRTWMLSDHKHDPSKLGNHVIRTKETKPHALSHANTLTTEDQLEDERREREARSKFDALTPVDREILRLHLVRTESREYELPFPASEREDKEAAGWLFVRHTRNGMVRMVKAFIGQLTYEEIAKRVERSERTVQRRLSAMDPSMIRYCEMRGWA